MLSYVDSELPKICLDIGCGTGQLTRELCHRGYACVGVDTSTKAIEIAKSLTVVWPELLTYIHLSENNAFAKLPHAPYSLITCKLAYTFIQNKPSFLQRVKDALASGGVFVVITPLPEDVVPEQRTIAAQAADMQLLTDSFKQLALYKDSGLTYFIGSTP